MGGKITEEAAEVVEAAGEPGDAGREHFIREVGDLLYHLLVLMQDRKCTLTDVGGELSRRFGVSGLAEKAARPKPAPKAPEAKTRAPRKKAKPKAKPTATRKKKAKAKR
jgi:phosphoribosyl-ATP pyrophosphohydrolase